ncbi:hypothetical protein [Streptomyces sp. MJP52]|uniref:hypothetical protein n=1 Tax=Streptomyces sp. MJP52 TaxID=2940555 RepID=UPI0024731C36|nr:hypothetical protein [Streptomyces sp. MJP52]MDH6223625.1 hypothetical protein [Streptomyces sp. MJP52]
MDQEERWYTGVYWPWKVAVAEEIRWAPLTAADLFAHLVPEHERPNAVIAGLIGYRTGEEMGEVERQEEREHHEGGAGHTVSLPSRAVPRGGDGLVSGQDRDVGQPVCEFLRASAPSDGPPSTW